MKRYALLLVCSILAVSLTGCATPQGQPNYTASGALAGGATGAIIGGVAARHSGAGALVGGALGAVVGSIIGQGMDQAQAAQLQAQAPQTYYRVQESQPLTIEDIKSLTRAGVSDDLIISQIRNSQTVYHLKTWDIIDMKNSKVSERVIDFMINTPSEIPSSEVSGYVGNAPPPPIAEPVLVAPGPGYYWISGAWLWLDSRWVWQRGYWHRPTHFHSRYRRW